MGVKMPLLHFLLDGAYLCYFLLLGVFEVLNSGLVAELKYLMACQLLDIAYVQFLMSEPQGHVASVAF